MPLATLVDTEALRDVALLSFAGGLGLVVAFGLGLVAWDRVEGRSAARAPWALTLVAAAIACATIVVVGLWAMTQK
jgi:hypothetical protein